MAMTAVRSRPRPARPVRLHQLPGLDGLRAIAVGAVIAYHLDPHWLPGGYLGVDVFFVISGYLITALLLAEFEHGAKPDLRRFLARRATRLLPALTVLLVATTVLAGCFARDGLNRLRGDVPASIFYVLNWRLVVQHDSYAAALGRPPLLLHLWSLSIEEQYYLLWPVALLVLRRRLPTARLAAAALAGAGVSAGLMAGLWGGGDPSRVYFATETHASGLLLGCALAIAVPPWRMASTVVPKARRLLERSGAVALAAVVAGMVTLGFTSPVTYRGGMFFVDLATAVVVATVAHPASRLGAALSRQPLRWAGQRSYSLYLWHWPLFEILRPGALGLGVAECALARLMLTCAVAEISYRYVEQPWRTGTAQFRLRVLAAGDRRRLGAIAAAPVLLVGLLLATASPAPAWPRILAVGATPAARRLPAPPPVPATPSGPVGTSAVTPTPVPYQPVPYEPVPYEPARPQPVRSLPSTTVATVAAPAPTPPTTSLPPPDAALVPPSAKPVLAVGDSVLLAASPELSAAFGPQVTVDAAVGRQVHDGIDRLAAYQASGALAHYKTVMVDLGTNGAFRPQDFDQMTRILAGVPRIVIFDVHADRPWAARSNATLLAGVAAHPNQMRVADWNATVTNPALLYSDGIHPDHAGALVYVQLLVKALLK